MRTVFTGDLSLDFYDFSTEMKSWMSSMDNNIKNMQRAMQLHPHGPYPSPRQPCKLVHLVVLGNSVSILCVC